MRSFAWVLVLIALFVALPVSAQTTVITLRAPFDGVVDLLPSMGEQKPQTPPALYSFNALRSEANKKGAKLNLRKLPPPPPAAAVANVVTLTSDVLDLQIIQDDALLAAAATRLKGAKDSLALEQNLSPEVEGARDADEVAGHMSVEAAYQNYLNHPLKADDDARYRDNANAARAHNFTVSKGRRQAQLAELTLRVKAAQAEYDAAEASLKIVKATRQLGNIVCPVQCTVHAVHAMVGQWVTKGDALIDVEITP